LTVNQRVKQVRESLGLSQLNFARKISISSGFLANIETERREVNNRIVKLICVTFGVSEKWIETGEGSMFPNETESPLTERFISIYKELNPEFQDYVRKQLDNLLKLQNDKSGK